MLSLASVRNLSSVKKVAFSAVFLILCSKISVPFYPVPLTLQLFAVYFLGLVLSPREAFFAGLSWFSLGALGLPVFSTSALAFWGPTVGYRIGMLVGMPLISFLASKNISGALACIACTLVVYLFGCIGLTAFGLTGIENVLAFGVVPFLIPDAVKLVLANASLAVIHRKK